MKQILLCLAMLMLIKGFGQDIPLKAEESMENQAMENEELQEDDLLLLQLVHYAKHPLHINAAGETELSELGLLSAMQIQNLLQYRKLMGDLLDIHELQAVPSFDEITIRRIMPYVVVKDNKILPRMILDRGQGQHSVSIRATRLLQRSKAYRERIYAGDPNNLLLRYRFQHRNLWYAGMTAEKDAGESFKTSSGFDFYSFHFFLRHWKSVKALALGDFTVNLGQGLVQWQGMRFGKSGDIMHIKKQGPVLQPYRSTGEYYFSRGGAVHLTKKGWEAVTFISYRKMDATSIKDSNSFSSLQTSGYHRTVSEIEDRKSVSLISMGGKLGWNIRRLKVAFNLVHHRLNKIWRKKAEPYLLHAPGGRSFLNYSLDYQYSLRNLHMFGELARNQQKGMGGLLGLMVSLDTRVDVSILFRKLDPHYYALFGNGFTESSSPSNETGWYVGMQVRPVHGVSLDFYADHFRFPWLRFRMSAPVNGFDYLSQLTWLPDRKSQFSIRIRTEKKALNTVINKMYFPEFLRKSSLRISFIREIENIFIRTRVEINKIKTEASEQQGFLWLCDFGGKWKGVKWNGRFQYHETDGYDARIYAYEQDVLYGGGTPAFYGKGIRYYFNLQVRLGKSMGWWLRWGESVSLDGNGWGSGNDQIDGSRKTEVRTQLIFELNH